MATSPKIRQHPDPAKLRTLSQRFSRWRANRQPGQRIPTELWQAAARLASTDGVSRISAALKLSYYDLQRRLARVPVPRPRPRVPPTFVQLPSPPVAPGLGEPGTVELVHASGARLTLRLPNATPRDLLPLVRAFLRLRR
jgi:hypothetical protein